MEKLDPFISTFVMMGPCIRHPTKRVTQKFITFNNLFKRLLLKSIISTFLLHKEKISEPVKKEAGPVIDEAKMLKLLTNNFFTNKENDGPRTKSIFCFFKNDRARPVKKELGRSKTMDKV